MHTRFLALLFATLAVLTTFAGVDPMVGTWKLNYEKSKFPSDYPVPKSETIIVQEHEGGLKLAGDAINSHGKPAHNEYILMFDGKDYPETGVAQGPVAGFGNGIVTVTGKRINARTVLVTRKRGGKVVSTQRTFISKDGKTRTSYWKGTNEKGEPRTFITVFDRQ